MLVNVTSEHYHPLYASKAKESFPEDSSMHKYIEYQNGERFYPTKYEGILISGSLNPHICTPPSYEIDNHLSRITLSKPVDKRNRKFQKALGFRETEFHLKHWDEIKELPQEELYRLQSTYTNRYYFKGYGVCDNEDQVYRMYKWLEDQDEEYCIFLTPIFKEHQPPHGGWRWEKWGEYIGNKESKADYLYDEPDIDMVYVYSVCKIKRKELVYVSKEGFSLYNERFGWEIEDNQGRTLGVIRPVKEAEGWYQVGYHDNPYFYTNDDEFDNMSQLLQSYIESNVWTT